MQFADSIQEAASRIEEAMAVYRFKARQIGGEYDDLAGRWSDARAQQFEQRHLQSQREAMTEGERLCRRLAELCDAAKRSACDAQSQLGAHFSLQSDYEASAGQVLKLLDEGHKLTTRVVGDTGSLSDEIRTVHSAAQETARDPGWKPKPVYVGPAKPPGWPTARGSAIDSQEPR